MKSGGLQGPPYPLLNEPSPESRPLPVWAAARTGGGISRQVAPLGLSFPRRKWGDRKKDLPTARSPGSASRLPERPQGERKRRGPRCRAGARLGRPLPPRPPQARPGPGQEGLRPLAPSRGRRGSAAGDCRSAGAPEPRASVGRPGPGDLGSLGRGRGAGTDCPPLPWGCYSGRRAQGPGMCTNRGHPALGLGVPGAAPTPPKPGLRPAGVPVPGHSSLSWSYPSPLPRGGRPACGGGLPCAWAPIGGSPIQVPATPSAGPQRTGEKLSPGGRARGAERPSQLAHSRALLSPGDAPHPTACPPCRVPGLPAGL